MSGDDESEYPLESNHLLKELETEREQMTNQIFNMRLRINFLEEKLLMYEAGNDMTDDDKSDEIVRLQTAYNIQKEEMEQKEQYLREAIAKAKVFEDHIRKQNTQIVQLSNQLDSSSQMSQTKEVDRSNEIVQMHDTLDRMRKTEKVLNERIGRSNEEIAKLQKNILEYQTALKKSEDEVKKYQAKYESNQDSMYQLRQQLGDHEADKARILSLEESTLNKENKIHQLLTQMERMKQELQTEARNGELQYIREVDQTKTENQLLRQKVEGLHEMEERLKQAHGQVERLRVEQKGLQSQIAALDQECTRYKAELEKADDRAEKRVLDEKDHGAQLVEQARLRIDSLADECSRLQSHCRAVETKLSQSEVNGVDLKRRLDNETMRSEQYKAEAAETLSIQSQYEMKIKELHAQMERVVESNSHDNRYTKEIETLRSHQFELQKQLDEACVREKQSQQAMDEWKDSLCRHLNTPKGASFQEHMDALSALKMSSEKELGRLEMQLEHMFEKKTELQEKLDRIGTTNKTRIQTLEAERSDLRSKMRDLEKQYNATVVDNTRLQERVKTKETDDHHLRLAESNRVLILELEERRAVSDAARKQLASVIKENNSLLLAVKNLKNQVEERDNQLEYYISRFQEMSIGTDPILKHVADTKRMMERTSNQLEQGRSGGLLMDRLDAIVRDASLLMRRSSMHWDKYEKSAHSDREAKHLLDGNVRLMRHLEQLVHEFESHLSASPAARPAHDEPEPQFASPPRIKGLSSSARFASKSPPCCASPTTTTNLLAHTTSPRYVGAARLHDQFRDQKANLSRLGQDLHNIEAKLQAYRSHPSARIS